MLVFENKTSYDVKCWGESAFWGFLCSNITQKPCKKHGCFTGFLLKILKQNYLGPLERPELPDELPLEELPIDELELRLLLLLLLLLPQLDELELELLLPQLDELCRDELPHDEPLLSE
jgi:hypothetical protein